jgi:hypothetical protein
MAGIFVFRHILVTNPAPNDPNGQTAQIISSGALALQIYLFNWIFGKVSRRLNDYENYRTQEEYENGLIYKTFLFKFVNSYASLFYIAFFKKYDTKVGGCLSNDIYCMDELQVTLGVIFCANIVLSNFSEYIVPYVIHTSPPFHLHALSIPLSHLCCH